jgi:nitroreductase
MFNILYSKLPAPLRRKRHDLKQWLTGWYCLLGNCIYDTQRLARHSLSAKSKGSRQNKAAKLIFLYHKIEKAMALPSPRPGFGRKWIPADFIPLLLDYHNRYGCDELVGTCCTNLKSYVRFNTDLGVEMDDVYDLIMRALTRIRPSEPTPDGGVINVTASGIHAAAAIDFQTFVNNRHSIRDFTSEEVEMKVIENAIRIAQRTPSVCNRQAWHVYSIHKSESILHALRYQNGNEGFKEKVKFLLMVTGDLSAMMNSSERNQIWVDGGMFSMSLVYALHSLKLGTCCLNLCHDAAGERQLREALKIAPNHSPVMMIAVGHIPESLRVPNSMRKSIQEMTTWE